MRLLRVSLIGVLAGLALSVVAMGTALAQPKFEFQLGFGQLARQIPDVVGEPVENEHHNPQNGDALQQTTRGLMAWRKADNGTAFTDGSRTWINGPFGVQERWNDQRFKWELPAPPPDSTAIAGSTQAGSVLAGNLIVSWYGNPHEGRMGVLGQFSGDDLAGRLQRQADVFAPLTEKRILPAYELIAVVAQGSPGADGLWRSREGSEFIDSVLEQARAHSFRLILDVQVGYSRVEDELEYLRPWLEQPDVYLALDPEFDMWTGQTPGQQIGHTTAAEVNYAISFLERVVKGKGLPQKVLVVHQFTLNMLPDKENIGRSPLVDLVLDVDGFGAQGLKLDTYRGVMDQPLQFAGVKLFYDQDPGMFSPEQVMRLDPVPSVVIYQ